MQQFITFVTHHWQLWLAFAVILSLLLGTELYGMLGKTSPLSPQQVVAMMNHQNALVIDIRDKASFTKGHILGAINVPFVQLKDHLAKIDAQKDQPVIVIDTLGPNANKAIALLRQRGCAKVYNLKGGINAWIGAGLPLAKK